MSDTDEIRRLNDAFRTTLQGGKIMLSRGVADRPDLPTIMARVRAFNDFHEGNDPYCERDFAAFKIGPDQLFFKIDYYDVDLQNGSPDPADITVTSRVLTVMLAAEY